MESMRWLYPWVVFTGLAVAAWLLRRRQHSIPVSKEDRIRINLAAFCGAMIGAKTPFLLDPSILENGWLWIADGKTILGGIFGGYLAVECTKWFCKIRVSTGDSFALPAAVAVAFGRMGCFIAGCCFGAPTQVPWGVHFQLANDPPEVLRHPIQIYEVIFHGVAALTILFWEYRSCFTQNRLKLYLMAYLVFRFLTEFLRPESILALGLTSYQWSALILFGILLILLAKSERKITSIRSDDAEATRY